MAGGKGSTFDNQILQLILNAVTIPGLAQNVTSGALAQLWLSLHTADPGAGGSQTTSEAGSGGYSTYARQAVPRTTAGFTVSGASATLAATVIFPTAPSGASETHTFAALGTAQTGTGEILYRGPITPVITVSQGVSPQLTSGTTFTES